MVDARVRRMDLADAKSTILTQIRETVFQCDLTLKAVGGVIDMSLLVLVFLLTAMT